MPYNFASFHNRVREITDWLGRELASIRSGRVTPTLLDGVMVEVYGSRLPLKQLGALSVEGPRTLRFAVWDKSQLKAVESAVTAANLGVGTAPLGGGGEEVGLRLIFPELTGEKKELLVRLANEKVEAAKISLRQERDRVWQDIQNREREGEIPEDDKFRHKEELQKIMDGTNKNFAAALARKTEEIKS